MTSSLFAYQISTGVLRIDGSQESDSVVVSEEDGSLVVRTEGTIRTSGGVVLNQPGEASIPLSDVSRIEILTLDGSDRVIVQTPSITKVTLYAGPGNDAAYIQALDAYFDTGSGIDIGLSAANSSYFHGPSGDNTLAALTGSFIAVAGDGNDTAINPSYASLGNGSNVVFTTSPQSIYDPNGQTDIRSAGEIELQLQSIKNEFPEVFNTDNNAPAGQPGVHRRNTSATEHSANLVELHGATYEAVLYSGHNHLPEHNEKGFNKKSSVNYLKTADLVSVFDQIADGAPANYRSVITLTEHTGSGYVQPSGSWANWRVKLDKNAEAYNVQYDTGVIFTDVGREKTPGSVHQIEYHDANVSNLPHIAQTYLKTKRKHKSSERAQVKALENAIKNPARALRAMGIYVANFRGKTVLVEMPKLRNENGDAVPARAKRVEFTSGVINELIKAGAHVRIVGSSDSHGHIEAGEYFAPDPFLGDRQLTTVMLLPTQQGTDAGLTTEAAFAAIKAGEVVAVNSPSDVFQVRAEAEHLPNAAGMGATIDFDDYDRFVIDGNSSGISATAWVSVRGGQLRKLASSLSNGQVVIDIDHSWDVAGAYIEIHRGGQTLGYSSAFLHAASSVTDRPGSTPPGGGNQNPDNPEGPSINLPNVQLDRFKFKNGILSFTDSKGTTDNISVKETGSYIEVFQNNKLKFRRKAEEVRGIEFKLGNGDDTLDIDIESPKPVVVSGGKGADTITVRNLGAKATIHGNNGNDRITSLDGDLLDEIWGDAGINDILTDSVSEQR